MPEALLLRCSSWQEVSDREEFESPPPTGRLCSCAFCNGEQKRPLTRGEAPRVRGLFLSFPLISRTQSRQGGVDSPEKDSRRDVADISLAVHALQQSRQNASGT